MLSPLVSQKLGILGAKENSADSAVLRELLHAGKGTPAIDRSFPLREAAAAFGTSNRVTLEAKSSSRCETKLGGRGTERFPQRSVRSWSPNPPTSDPEVGGFDKGTEYYGRPSNTRLNGVSVARRNEVKPADLATSLSFASPAWAPRPAPTSCDNDAGVQMRVDAA